MSAPSFPSFPPSFSSFPDLDTGPSTNASEPLKTRDFLRENNKKKKRHDKSDTRGEKRKRTKNTSNSKGYTFDDDERLKANEDSKSQVKEETSRLFFSDGKGDRYNVEYGGLHAGEVPKYHIVDRGRNILGLSFAWTANRRSGKGIEVGLRGRRKMTSLTDSSSRALLASAPTRRIVQSEDTYKYREIDGFLRLPTGRRRQTKNDQSYRSITLPKNEVNSDSESSEASEDHSDDEISEDESDTLILTSHQLTLKQLDQKLKEDPNSVDNWLQLLSHTLSTIPLTSKNATTARSEITLAILSRALAADIRNTDSKILRFKYLKAGEEVWHESKLRAEWEDALKIGGAEIWMEWFEWRIRRGNDGVDGVVKDALRILSVLEDSEQDEILKVRVFWRLAVAIQNAGFTERAIAMLQAQTELMYEVPQALYGLPHEMQLDQLEEFWESDAPRMGEEGAKGWAAWVSFGKQYHESSSATVRPSNISELDPYRQWAAKELEADRTHFLPSHSFEESDDPYRTILFPDIRSLLIQIQSPVAKNAFRQAWLAILGLHIPGFSASLSLPNEINWDDRWNQGHLLRSSYLAVLFPGDATQTRITTEAVMGVIVGREKEYASGFGPVQCWGYGVVGPLDIRVGDEWKGKARYGLWKAEDIEGLDVPFVKRLFAQLRLGADDVEWDILALAFEAATNIKSAIKLSRTLLSMSESLPCWSAHAQLETMRGRLDDARKVYQAVLVASGAALPLRETALLWWNWAEMEWLAGNAAQALQVILRAAGVEGQGVIAALRGRRGLDDAIKEESQWKEREGLIKMRALLELLTGSEPSAVFTLFDEHLSGERTKSVRRESLTASSLTMLYNYGVILKNPMPPSVLRQRVEKALEDYPSNSVILGIFLEGERGQGIWGRVREKLGESNGKAKDVARRVEEVWITGWESGRWIGEVERTRSGLAAAVEHERTRASHIVWRIYIEFEIRARELQRAKKLLFRAIGECPLVKDLYLLAFGPLRGVFSGRELNGLADTMVERGLRIRQGINEGWKEVEKADDNESDDESEIAANARELRRLMPY